MTRERAIEIWRACMVVVSDCTDVDRAVEEGATKAVDGFVALGMLKLQEPKTAREKFKDALDGFGYQPDSIGMERALKAFDASQK